MSDNNANNDPIANALNLSPIPGDKPGTVMKLMDDAMDDSAKADFTQSRANILNVIDAGTDSLESLISIAKASQHPRAFEVVAKLMDTMVNASEKLLQLQKTVREIDNADVSNNPSKVVNNNLFVGSTAELGKLIRNSMKTIDDDGDR